MNASPKFSVFVRRNQIVGSDNGSHIRSLIETFNGLFHHPMSHDDPYVVG